MRKSLRFSCWLVLAAVVVALLPSRASGTSNVLSGGDLGSIGAAFGTSVMETQYAKVTTQKGTLNMRAEPKDSAKVVAKLPKGAVVQVTGGNAEEGSVWTEVLYKEKAGYVKSSFLEVMKVSPYAPITIDDKGDAVMKFKKAMHKLGYLKSEEINTRFDAAMVSALTKMQLMNNVALNPDVVTPELQAMMDWGVICKAKTGYIDTAADKQTGLTVSVFVWDIGGTLYDKDESVKVKLNYAAQASGGQPPYTITVKKSLSPGGDAYADLVTNPFSQIWSRAIDRLYVYATVVDAAGNTVTACAPYRYALPPRYSGELG